MSNYKKLVKDLNYLKPVITYQGSKWTEIFPTGQDSYILSEGITSIIKKIAKAHGKTLSILIGCPGGYPSANGLPSGLAGNYTLIPAPLTFNRELGQMGIGYVVMEKIARVTRLPNYPDRCLIVFFDDSDALCWCSADLLISTIEQAKKKRPQHNLSPPNGEYSKERAGIYLVG